MPAATSLLVTQCLQRDFVDPVGAQDPLPNRLHVGHAEAQRLLGPDPSRGPVAQLFGWARAQPTDSLALVHILDWHDPDDPAQRDHLRTFGEHCIRGTPGAEPVMGRDPDASRGPREHVVHSVSLNDFEGTGLAAILDEARARGPVRVGVVGVWTEAKVSFLLYDLKTRGRIDELATCSALTASASRLQHFNALEQLRRILGVRVFDSVGEFAAWLVPDATVPITPPAPATGAAFRGSIALDGCDAPLEPEDAEIVGFLYRDAAKVTLRPLSGGFSGARVFQAAATDLLGHRQSPSVVKLGPRGLIGKERASFERVEEVLGNSAPAVRGFVDMRERAGIKYGFASMGQGKVRSLKSLFDERAPWARIERVLRLAFEEVLEPFTAAARYERLPLLDHYGFAPRWAPRVRENVAAIVGPERAREARLTFEDGTSAPNVCGFYERFLVEEEAAGRGPDAIRGHEFHYRSYVHGDLNGANILVDSRENVWVIDFFHTAPGHVLKDVAKLENDLLYIFTPLADEADLRRALALTRALRAADDLRAPLPGAPPEGIAADPDGPDPLARAWAALRLLRGLAASLCREDRHPIQLDVALLRYAVHTLGFEECSPLQKRWALASACALAARVEATIKAERTLRVDWLPREASGGRGRLGLTICPGRRDRGRDLARDLDALRDAGAARLLTLLGDDEVEWAGVGALGAESAARGIEWRRIAVRDQAAPSLEEARDAVAWLDAALDAGRDAVVHCMGGLGRSGLVAACALVARGATPAQAIEHVRAARGPRAVETPDQERFVELYAAR
jgi:protein-tyrosine phosphatase/nicotinamidase-related amidase